MKSTATRILVLVLAAWLVVEATALGSLVVLRRFAGLEYATPRTFLSAESISGLRQIARDEGRRYWQYDPNLGWSGQPGGTHLGATMNAQGLRSKRVYAESPPPGVVRIAAFGDSFVHGDEVPDGKEWAALLEASRPDLEVLNFGVSGYGPDQAFLRWERDGAAYHPDVVLIGVMPDDVDRMVATFWPFHEKSAGWLFPKPRFRFEGDELVLEPNPIADVSELEELVDDPEPMIQRLGRHDAYFQRLSLHSTPWDVLPSVRFFHVVRDAFDRRGSEVPGAVRGISDPSSEAYRLTERVLLRFCASVRKAHAEPIVVFLPAAREVRPGREGAVPDYRALAEALEAKGCPTVDTLDAFRRVPATTPTEALFGGFHYSVLGNEIVARHLEEALAPVLAARSAVEADDILLIVVDTLRAKSLSLFGYERDTSPNLVRFARDAVVFDEAISPGTWTVPAHGSLFTGKLPSFHGAERVPGDRLRATPLHPEIATLAELLRDRGWATGAFVANSTYVTPALGFDRGFDVFDAEDLPADRVIERARRWLENQPGRSFLFVNLLDPHEPYAPPGPWADRYPGRDERFGESLTALARSGQTPTSEMLEHFRSQYDGEVAFTDRAIGELLEALQAEGRYEDSLVVVTSDHGEMFGEHGEVGHGGKPFEELVHVPLIVKYPGGRGAGTRVRRRVSTLGVFATVLATAGVPLPEGVQAHPLEEPHPVWVEDVNFVGERVTVGYSDDHKLVHFSQSPDGVDDWASLYELDRDPGEDRPQSPLKDVPLARSLVDLVQTPRPTNPAPAPAIDPERERRLRALGYVGE